MITYHLGTDLRISYDWCTTAGAPITPDAATFTVDDISWTLDDDTLNTSEDHTVELHLPDDLALDAGSYAYRVTATLDADTVILGDGLLRVKP